MNYFNSPQRFVMSSLQDKESSKITRPLHERNFFTRAKCNELTLEIAGKVTDYTYMFHSDYILRKDKIRATGIIKP